jgi:hypothetical protein
VSAALSAWGLCAAAILAVTAAGCHMESSKKPEPIPVPSARNIEVFPRTELLPTYPCSGCHADRAARPERHLLKEFHQIRNEQFSHGEQAFWCYECHSQKNIDHLQTATGKLVTFDEAYKVCTSCHGDKLKDWREGIHGQIQGNWNGVKHKKSCPACHDPHNPRFPSLKPEKAPAPPRRLRAL